MVKPTIRTDDRKVIVDHLRGLGKKLNRDADNGTVSREVAKLTARPFPVTQSERVELLLQFLSEIRADAAKRAANREIRAFRPLRITPQMRIAEERAKELYPDRTTAGESA